MNWWQQIFFDILKERGENFCTKHQDENCFSPIQGFPLNRKAQVCKILTLIFPADCISNRTQEFINGLQQMQHRQ